MYMKSILMLYRGKDESNKVSSATKMMLDKDKLGKLIPFEVINVDKRTLDKYLSKLDNLPDVVYVWYEDEITIDFLIVNYPDIELRIYNTKKSRESKTSCKGSKYTYILAKYLIDEYKSYHGTIDMWVVENNKVKPVVIYSCDYLGLDEWAKKKYFSTEADANKCKISKVESEIKSIDEMIEYYKKKKESLIAELKGCVEVV